MGIIKNNSKLKLPSNKKFGFFFSGIFLILFSYFLFIDAKIITFVLGTIFVSFFFVTILKASLLFPLNYIWMRFGILLSKLVSPIVLGVIFFFMFTPVAVIIRIIGRDELCLRLNSQKSYWIKRKSSTITTSFDRQF